MNSWTYPIGGVVHYFTKAAGGYSPSGVLRSMALFIDGLEDDSSVEAIVVYPEYADQREENTWAGWVAVYHDRPSP